MPDVWVEVDLSALKRNVQQVTGTIGDRCKLIAVVKANGYGHGYVEPAKAFLGAGAHALAVTRLEEALVLRRAGVDAPILVLAPVLPENTAEALEANLQITATNSQQITHVSQTASSLGVTAALHLKIDSGMGRLGTLPVDLPEVIQALKEASEVTLAGVFTHFAEAAAKDLAGAKAQLAVFGDCVRQVRESGLGGFIVHAANSAATIRMPEARFDAVRVGTLLYGQYPSEFVRRKVDVKSAWQMKARVCDLRNLPTGTRVGYGAEFSTKGPTRAAIIPAGFADGFTLAPEGPFYRQSPLEFIARKSRRRLCVDINGVKAPVIGRVAMQMIVVDVTGVEAVTVGSEAVIPCMRIPSSPLVPRVYVESGG